MKIIKEVNKIELRNFLYRSMDINDKNLYVEMMNPNSIGIFQMNGGTAQRLVNEIHPDNFDELNACNAMARPGPIENAPAYIQRKNGAKSPYPELMNEIIKNTYSTCLYQEQIMKIFQVVGGFSLIEADDVRGLMKKLGKADKDPEDLKKWNSIVKKFNKGALSKGISEKDAEKITNDLISFSGYSFNLAHSTAYTYIAVMTLYLSFYFRKYFYSAVLTYEVDRDKYLFERLQAVKSQGFKIIPPDVNKSGIHIQPLEENIISFGLQDIKGIGEKAVEKIINERPFSSIFDFIIRARGNGVTSAVINALIKSGAMDELIKGERKRYIQIFNQFWENKGSTKIEEKLKAIWNKIEENANRMPFLDTAISDLRFYEKDLYGFNFFTSLFTDNSIQAFMKMKNMNLINYSLNEVSGLSRKTPVCVNEIRIIKDKNKNEMAFVSLEDVNGSIVSAPIFASYWKFIKSYLTTNTIYLLNLYKDNNDNILFGQKAYTNKETQVLRMVKKIL